VQLKRGAAFQPDVAAKAVYDTTWNSKTRLQVGPVHVRVRSELDGAELLRLMCIVYLPLQRDFAVFGGEFLMVQDAGNLRGFFDSFFKLPEGMWAVRTQPLFLHLS
jgi:hypothetical protein